MADVVDASLAKGVVRALYGWLVFIYMWVGLYVPTLSRHMLVASVQMAKSAREVRFVSLQDWTWSWQPFGISLANFM
jgi:hypothetical protein